MKHQRKEEHIKQLAFAIKDGASGYITEDFEIYNLPAPQRAGTLTQQDAYANHKARQIIEEKYPEVADDVELCLKYLTLAGYDAHEDDGSVFLRVDDHLEVQLSSSEVNYRADLYKESLNNDPNDN